MAEVSLPKSRPKNAAAIVKRDLKESKLKVPEISEETKKHLDQMAMLEIRAELDPYLQNNPLARVGFDIIERGEEIDGKSGGELLAYISSRTPNTDPNTGLEYKSPAYSLSGMLSPSDSMERDQDFGSLQQAFGDNEDFAARVLYQQGQRGSVEEGIGALLPTSEGSTVYYQTGKSSNSSSIQNRPKEDLSTLMHELAHLGVRAVEKANPDVSISMRREENAMDFLENRASGREALNKELPSRTPAIVKDLEKYAQGVRKQRGMPPTVLEKPEPGIMESILGMFK